jgi:hypothetical protein
MEKRDRRVWPRQAGYISVHVLDPEDALEEPFAGWLINYSPGGVCLSLRGSTLDNRSVLRLQPVLQFPGLSWVDVRVRNCRRSAGWTIFGCQFLRGGWEWLTPSA